jgi:hypothetical protein
MWEKNVNVLFPYNNLISSESMCYYRHGRVITIIAVTTNRTVTIIVLIIIATSSQSSSSSFAFAFSVG